MNGPIIGDDVPAKGQEQGEGLLGDAVLVGARGDRDDHVVAGGGLQVDQVISHAGSRDDSQPGGDGEHLGCEPLAAGEHRVGPGQVGSQLLGRQGKIAHRVDQLEPGVREHLAKRTGLVAEEVGTDQNAGHGKRSHPRQEPGLAWFLQGPVQSARAAPGCGSRLTFARAAAGRSRRSSRAALRSGYPCLSPEENRDTPGVGGRMGHAGRQSPASQVSRSEDLLTLWSEMRGDAILVTGLDRMKLRARRRAGREPLPGNRVGIHRDDGPTWTASSGLAPGLFEAD